MVDQSQPRRTVMKVGATALAAPLLAGCGGDSDGNGGGGGTDEPTDGGGDVRSFDGWFDSTDNYDGVDDHTGSGSVTVKVGTGDNGYQFSPPAISVDPGTTVTWEWTGKGQQHNVEHPDGAFESKTTGEEGFTFEHTFEEAGTYKYICTPHEALGMKGVVVVGE